MAMQFSLTKSILRHFACALLISLCVTAQNGGGREIVLAKCWEIGTVEAPLAKVSDGTNLYFLTDGSLQAYELRSGKKVWSTELGGKTASNLAANEESLFVVSNPVGTAESARSVSVLRSISKESGITNWSANLRFSERSVLSVTPHGLVSFGFESVSALYPLTGQIKWTTGISEPVSSEPAFSSGLIVFGTKNKTINALRGDTGAIVFRHSVSFAPSAVQIVSENELVWGDDRGNLASMDRVGDISWKFKSGARISDISLSGETLLVTSHDNFIYAVSSDSGSVQWKKRMPGRVSEKPLIAGELAIVIVAGEKEAQLIHIGNGRSLGSLNADKIDFFIGVPMMSKENSFVFGTSDGFVSYTQTKCPAQ